MNSEKKNNKFDSLSNKNKSVVSTDTELHLELFADPSKLKAVPKVINVSKSNIVDDSEDSHIVDKALGNDSDSNTSSDSNTKNNKYIKKSSSNKSSSSSSKSSSSSSSSSSKSSRSSKKVKSEAHKKMDNYIQSYNNNRTDNNATNGANTTDNKGAAMPNVYIPKYQTEREIRFRKMELLCILKNIKKSGRDLSKDYTINSDLEEIEMEVRFHTENEQKRVSVGFAKDGLLKACQFFEIMNNTFDPFGINLKGWHGQMNSNIDNYDSVFEELYEKYKNYIGRVEPEYKLMYMIFGSAASFHYSKQFVDQFGLDKVLDKNPELLQKIQANIASTMEKNIGKKDEPVKQKNNIPNITQQDMYKEMLKEKEILERKVKEQEQRINNTTNNMNHNNIHQQSNVNDTINKMMSIQQNGQNNGMDMRKPSQLSDLLNKVKGNTNRELLIPLEDSATSNTRIKITNTIDSETISESDNLNSISNLRKTRRQRAKINV